MPLSRASGGCHCSECSGRQRHSLRRRRGGRGHGLHASAAVGDGDFRFGAQRAYGPGVRLGRRSDRATPCPIWSESLPVPWSDLVGRCGFGPRAATRPALLPCAGRPGLRAVATTQSEGGGGGGGGVGMTGRRLDDSDARTPRPGAIRPARGGDGGTDVVHGAGCGWRIWAGGPGRTDARARAGRGRPPRPPSPSRRPSPHCGRGLGH